MGGKSGLAALSTESSLVLGVLVRRVESTPATGDAVEVAEYLRTTTAALAQDRYKGSGPKFIKRGSRVLYRWSDVLEWLDRNTIQRTDDRRTQ
jgi:hypothetical protein